MQTAPIATPCVHHSEQVWTCWGGPCTVKSHSGEGGLGGLCLVRSLYLLGGLLHHGKWSHETSLHPPNRQTLLKTLPYSSGSSGRVRGGAEKHEIYAVAFSSHLFYDLFSQDRGGHGPLGPPRIRYCLTRTSLTAGKGKDVRTGYIYHYWRTICLPITENPLANPAQLFCLITQNTEIKFNEKLVLSP